MASGGDSVEYIALKESLDYLTDCLAGHEPVITPLSTKLFASHLIPGPVHDVAQNNIRSAYDRANKLFSSVLATLKAHHNPNEIFSSLITSLQKAGLKDIATILEERLSKLY